jgi:hypothetical protein
MALHVFQTLLSDTVITQCVTDKSDGSNLPSDLPSPSGNQVLCNWSKVGDVSISYPDWFHSDSEYRKILKKGGYCCVNISFKHYE